MVRNYLEYNRDDRVRADYEKIEGYGTAQFVEPMNDLVRIALQLTSGRRFAIALHIHALIPISHLGKGGNELWSACLREGSVVSHGLYWEKEPLVTRRS